MQITTVHLTEEQIAALRREHQRTGIRVSVLIRTAISEWLRSRDAIPSKN